MPGGSREPSRSTASLENQNELLQFLKAVRPEWSFPRKHGHSDVRCVLKKLEAIGVTSCAELAQGVKKNTINEQLAHAEYSVFSKDTIDTIRKRLGFFGQLKALNEKAFRQTGPFAPVPQLLSKKKLGVLARANDKEGEAESSSKSVKSTNSPEPKPPLKASASFTESVSNSNVRLTNSLMSPTSLNYSSTTTSMSTKFESFDALSRPRLKGAKTGHRRPKSSPEVKTQFAVRLTENLHQKPGSRQERTTSFEEFPAAVEETRPSTAGDRDWAADALSFPGTPAARRLHPSMATQHPSNIVKYPSEPNLLRPPTAPGSGGGEAALMAASRNSSGNASVATRNSVLTSVNARGSVSLGSSVPLSRMEDTLGATPTTAFGNLLSPLDRAEAQYHDLDDMASEVERIQREGAMMCYGSYRAPAWSVLKSGPDALIAQGQAVVDEQEELKEKQRLYKIMDTEGLFSPMRQHVTKNIRHRTRQDAESAAAENVEIRHVEIAVRKQLGSLANSRKDLASVKRKLDVGEISLENPAAGLSMGAVRSI